MAPPFEAILFDFDGVLVDSEPVHFACWRDLLAALGVTLTWEQYHARFIGYAHRPMLDLVKSLMDPQPSQERMWEIYAEKQRMYHERTAGGHMLTAEVRHLLHELAGKWRLALVTSSGRADVEGQLRAAGVLECFEATVYREEVTQLKPSPECYVLAAQKLGIGNALVLEDSEPGQRAALAAGFELLAVSNSAQMPAQLRGYLLALGPDDPGL